METDELKIHFWSCSDDQRDQVTNAIRMIQRL